MAHFAWMIYSCVMAQEFLMFHNRFERFGRCGFGSGFGIGFLGIVMLLVLGSGTGCKKESTPTDVEQVSDTAGDATAAVVTATGGVGSVVSATPAAPVAGTGVAEVAGLPPIVFDPPVMDVGMVGPNEIRRIEVAVRNPTDRPLRVVASRASCTCTSVNLANQVIPAGESIPLVADFDSGGRLGLKNAAVRVLIEGYEEVAEIKLLATVTLPVRAEPAFLKANRLKAGVDTTIARPTVGDFESVTHGEYAVYSLDGRPFTILAVDGRPPTYLDYNPAIEGPRNRYRLSWDLSEYNPQTCLNAVGERMPSWWVIETDHPECPVFDMQVRHNTCTRPVLRVAGQDWFFADRRILMGLHEPGESVEIETTIKWFRNAERNDQFVTVRSESPQFTAELVSITPKGDDFVCKMKITPDPQHRGLLKGSLRLYSTKTSVQLLVIGKVGG